MDLGLDGRVAVVTGGSRGIGRAISLRLGREGAHVAVTYRHDASAAEEVVREISSTGGGARSVFLDLGALESVSNAIQSVLGTWGRIDVLVNNAVEVIPSDQTRPLRVDRLDPVEWQRLMISNVHGTFAAVQSVLRPMLSRGWGRIVIVSSTAMDDGMPGYG